MEDARTVSERLLDALHALGVRLAFGVVGGALAGFCDALARSPIRFVHARHESGAAFAATEASFASDRPTLVFATTGPGLMNALTGIAAARWEGAKVVLVTACTPAPLRGRGACQETTGESLGLAGLCAAGALFHHAVQLEHPAELEPALARLRLGLARPGGFVAHLALPTTLQTAPAAPAPAPTPAPPMTPTCGPDELDDRAATLAREPVVIWAGHGARGAAAELRALALRSGARVMTTPRGKGVFPERHPAFLGVTGLGGHGAAEAWFAAARPAHVLVLGTRLGEPSSFFTPALEPARSFLHVDLDPDAPGRAYPHVPTRAIHAEVRGFLTALVARWPGPSAIAPDDVAREPPIVASHDDDGPVHPARLMRAVQDRVVDDSDAVVLTESGNAFAWGNHCLRFAAPGRYRVSVGFGAMGHAACGVVGAALARAGKAVAIVGDGALLMNNEISTAVQHEARAVWIVLNDAGYGMVEHGMRMLGLRTGCTRIPRVDFVAVARAMGADGVRVERAAELDAALRAAMASPRPFVVDVIVDASVPGPWAKRIEGLIAQGATRRGDA